MKIEDKFSVGVKIGSRLYFPYLSASIDMYGGYINFLDDTEMGVVLSTHKDKLIAVENDILEELKNYLEIYKRYLQIVEDLRNTYK